MAAGARKYDNSRRQSQGRERILEAGLSLARSSRGWDWSTITFKAVAEAAEVSERTVYRHFATQRELHESLMLRINEQAAISYDGLTLDGLGELVERLFNSLSTFTRASGSGERPSDAAIAMNQERMQALLAACDGDVRRAALIDVLWSNESFERLTAVWRLSTEEAVGAVTGAVRALDSLHDTAPPAASEA